VRGLRALCKSNYSSIVESFPNWQNSPADIEGRPEAINRYGSSLVAIAEAFEQMFGEKTLIKILTGSPAENPLIRWQGAMTRARVLVAEKQYAEAARILEDTMIDASRLTGPGANEMFAHSWGNLGLCYYHMGRLEEALVQTERALVYCQTSKDLTGAKTYLSNLINILTKLGRSDEASQRAEELARAEFTMTQPRANRV